MPRRLTCNFTFPTATPTRLMMRFRGAIVRLGVLALVTAAVELSHLGVENVRLMVFGRRIRGFSNPRAFTSLRTHRETTGLVTLLIVLRVLRLLGLLREEPTHRDQRTLDQAELLGGEVLGAGGEVAAGVLARELLHDLFRNAGNVAGLRRPH